jgi:hypothetical protein
VQHARLVAQELRHQLAAGPPPQRELVLAVSQPPQKLLVMWIPEQAAHLHVKVSLLLLSRLRCNATGTTCLHGDNMHIMTSCRQKRDAFLAIAGKLHAHLRVGIEGCQ